MSLRELPTKDEESSGEETETETETESEEEDEEKEPWRHSIFGCFDHGVGQCCVMCICDPCMYAQAINTAFHGEGCCYACCCFFGHIFCCCNRAKLRAKYSLEAHNLGGAVGDCITVTCCCWCARCQQILEIETREGMLFGPCSARRGNPLRTRAANTGGPMRRNKVVPVDANSSAAEQEPLTKDDTEIATLESAKQTNV